MNWNWIDGYLERRSQPSMVNSHWGREQRSRFSLAGTFVPKGPFEEDYDPRMNANGGRVRGYELEDIGGRGRRDFLIF